MRLESATEAKMPSSTRWMLATLAALLAIGFPGGMTSTAKVTPLELPKYFYEGCYTDATKRDLAMWALKSEQMTIDVCFKECLDKGFEVFAVQDRVNCFCGHGFGAYGRVPDAECSHRCEGNADETCGGKFRNSVYRIFAASPSVNPPSPPSFSYRGCYIDKQKRDLPVWTFLSENVTIDACFEHCKSRGFEFFGLQAGDQCHCGDNYGMYISVLDDECSQKCNGNSEQICGAGWRNSVYRIEGLESSVLPSEPYKYRGCYKDDASLRDLSRRASDSTGMTLDFCLRTCESEGYAFFGVQNETRCFCGNDYALHGSVPDAECSSPCSGNSSQVCGGSMYNSVYSIASNEAAATPQKQSIELIGCYEDRLERDLPQQVQPSYSMTSEFCCSVCRAGGYAYCGTQNGLYCFCGNSFGKYGSKAAAECSTECAGDGRQMCGGSMRNSVYRITRQPGTIASRPFQYLGCFRDRRVRDLSLELPASEFMTNEACYKSCKDRHYAYFGTQKGVYCQCGNSFGKYGRVQDSSCRHECRGDAEQKCGYSWLNSVYKIVR